MEDGKSLAPFRLSKDAPCLLGFLDLARENPCLPATLEPRVALRQNVNHFKHFRSEIVAIASGISTSQPIIRSRSFSSVNPEIVKPIELE
jgi:hypothetical protein